MLGPSSLRNLDKEKISNYKERAVDWGKKTLIGALTAGAIASPLYTDVSALADEKEVTVPTNQVVKIKKLSPEQLSKEEVNVPMSWVRKDYLEEEGYLSSENSAAEREVQKKSEKVENGSWSLSWEADFEEGNLDGFRPAAVDLSVGCDRYKATEEDVLAHAVKDYTAPEGEYVLELVANSENEGGTFVNAITARNVPFEDDSLYKLTGYFKAVGDSKQEMLDTEFQLINEKGTEYVSSFIWYLNHFNKSQYEQVMVPTKENDEPPFLKAFELNKDDDWHYFEIIGEYRDKPLTRNVKSIEVDNKEKEIDEEMMIVNHPFKNISQVLLETHNMYTNCNPKNHFTGKSRWDEIKLYKKPLGKE